MKQQIQFRACGWRGKIRNHFSFWDSRVFQRVLQYDVSSEKREFLHLAPKERLVEPEICKAIRGVPQGCIRAKYQVDRTVLKRISHVRPRGGVRCRRDSAKFALGSGAIIMERLVTR